MINRLKEYQDFVREIINDEDLNDITDEKFALRQVRLLNIF